MAGSGSRRNSKASKRWRFVELFKLHVIRNIAISVIIAAGVVAVIVIVLTSPRLHPPQQHPSPPAITPSPKQELPPALPEDPPSQVVPIAQSGFEWNTLIPPPAEMMEGIPDEMPMIIDSEGRRAVGGRGNVFTVVMTEDYTHSVCVMGKGKRMHTYQFKYACGCGAITTPDPYRDVIFAYPLKVAEKYKSELCKECKQLQKVLDEKEPPAEPGTG